MLYLSWEEMYDLLPQSFYAWNEVFISGCDSAVDGLGRHPVCARWLRQEQPLQCRSKQAIDQLSTAHVEHCAELVTMWCA